MALPGDLRKLPCLVEEWACNRMIDNNKPIIFACQVLEYQPEPSNRWTTVGQLETGRRDHAVLSIDSEALPCLQGCIGQDDLFVGSSLSKEFSSSSSCLSGLSYLWRFYKADDHDHLIINCLWEWWRPLANILL